MERYVVIVAGGKGLRMGTDIPKQFLLLQGRPVLMHTIDAFRRTYADIHIILVLPREQQDYWRSLCEQYEYGADFEVADGGETRNESVRNGLALIPDGAEGIVGVHDGVRPLVSSETICRCYDAAAQTGAAIPVVPVVETIRRIMPEGDSVTMNRDLYRLVQTPQVFGVSLLKKVHEECASYSFTDDASMLEAVGHPVTLVDGNRENIKLTSPADMKMAEGMM
ncbi:MAG: 2-C-methyl-D-erythritol 4-phosphate cytidylyltransferase [Bacteroidaceae bacterium]|nr:2-C-methyl-D-erythritol 4-phosphate cytidylyltransferase [Bacteroidaceae bacterium]